MSVTTVNSSPSSPVSPDDIHLLQDAHAARLDADMFSADDIHGVTEGLTGSGNLNYLVLQAGQTNELGHTANPFNYADANYSADKLAAMADLGLPGQGGTAYGSAGAGGGLGANALGSGYNFHHGTSQVAENLTDNGSATTFNSLNTSLGSHAISVFGGDDNSSYSNSTLNQFFDNGLDGLNGSDGQNGVADNGQNGSAGLNGTGNDGANGNNGNNGANGHDGGTPDTNPTHSDLNVNLLSDILGGNVHVGLDPIGNIIGETHINVDAALGNILSTSDGILPNPGVIVDALVGDNQLIDNLHIDTLTQPVEHLADNLVDTVNPLLNTLLPNVPDPQSILSSVVGILGTPGTDPGLTITGHLGLPDIAGLNGLGNINATIPLAPVSALLGTTDLHVNLDAPLNNLLSDHLNLQPITAGITSDGQVLSGLDTLLSTGDLGGTLQSSVGNLLDTLAHGALPVNDLPGSIQAVAGDLGSSLGTVVGGVTSDLSTDVSHLPDALGATLSDLPAVGTGVETTVSDLLTDLGSPATGGDLGNVTSPLLNGITTGLNNLLTGAADTVSGSDLAHAVSSTASQIVEGASGILGGLAGTPPSGGSGGDTDVTAQTGIDLGHGVHLADTNLTTVLDPVENIVGDVDAHVNATTDAPAHLLAGDVPGTVDSLIHTVANAATVDVSLLHPEANQNAPLSANLTGNLGLGTLLGDTLSSAQATVGGVLGLANDAASHPSDVLATVAGGGSTALPSPEGVVSSGLSLIHDISSDSAASGGLLGNHHTGLLG